MTDDVKAGRAEPVAVGPPRRRMSRAARARAERHRRRRRLVSGLSVAALIVVAIALVFVGSRLWHSMTGSPNDFTGDGVDDVVIQIHDGDSTTAVGQTLVEANVVATAKGFVEAASGSAEIAAIQPGFYRVRTEIPAALAVEKLADPSNRVGKLTIPEGRQLDDTADVKTNAVTDGLFSLISKASCVELNGEQRCVPADELKAAASTTPLEELRVPDWAAERVLAMGSDHRRIEGLIAPGTWNVDPDGTPQSILASLIGSSAVHYANRQLIETAANLQMSPYDVLVVGSLVQKEATPEDFAKVARVIYNRLAVPQRLEFDSTVNYSLDRQEVATTDADRARVTPWNTYASEGLPATPIGAPGDPALDAAEHPAPGDWLYFVTIDMQGTTLFTRDYEQHLANIVVAQRNGVLDSAR
jgi:UPF0755 protein